jgi:hypothetical protein
LSYSLSADIVLGVHLVYACFVVFGFAAIVVGKYFNWEWTRSLRFRVLHLACTAFVAVEALLGVSCPLTVLENRLLQAAGKTGYEQSFMGNLVNYLLYYEAPEWIFTLIYVSLTLLVLLAFLKSPPRRSPDNADRSLTAGPRACQTRSSAPTSGNP